jgi:hypothetical protein
MKLNERIDPIRSIFRVHCLRTQIKPSGIIRIGNLQGRLAEPKLPHVGFLKCIFQKVFNFAVDADAKVTSNIAALGGRAETVHIRLYASDGCRKLRKFGAGVLFVLSCLPVFVDGHRWILLDQNLSQFL